MATNRARPTCALLVSLSLCGIPAEAGEPIACCQLDQTCDEVTHQTCVLAGGVPGAPGSTCTGVTCPLIVWSQPPMFPPTTTAKVNGVEAECFLGWHARSVVEPVQIGTAEFMLDAGASLDSIVWWGSFADWREPTDPAPPPSSFLIALWENEPAGVGKAGHEFQHPGKRLFGTSVPYGDVPSEPSGCDIDANLGGNEQVCRRYEWESGAPIFVNTSSQPVRVWLSIAASYTVENCECYPDLVPPADFVDFDDVAAIEALLGCDVDGDPVCEEADTNCDGVVDAFDVQAATCLAVYGTRDPSCCVSDTAFSWGWTTRPRETGSVLDLRIVGILEDELGVHAITSVHIDTNGDTNWEFSFAVGSSGNEVSAPPAPLPLGGLVPRSRYITFDPNQIAPDPVAFRVRVLESETVGGFAGTTWWAGVPGSFPEGSNPKAGEFVASALECAPTGADWTGIGRVDVFGEVIAPNSSYAVAAVYPDCLNIADPACFSEEIVLQTGEWADAVDPIGSTLELPQPDLMDILATVDKFLGSTNAPTKPLVQLEPNLLDPSESVQLADILAAVDSFLSSDYPHTGPASPCP